MYKEKIATTKGAQPQSKTPQQALAILMRQCARAEKCSGDALRSMRRWGLSEEESQELLQRLIRERFIDDGRYASAYVRDKMRLSGWGREKIRQSLHLKGVDAKLIAEALGQIEPEADMERLEVILRRKMNQTKAQSEYDLKGKLVRFGLSRGFGFEEVIETSERLLREREG